MRPLHLSKNLYISGLSLYIKSERKMKMLHYPATHMTTPMSLSFPNVPRRLPPQPPRRPLKRCCSLSLDQKTGGGKGMSWFHETELQVREYELDQYHVVQNSNYVNYSEYAIHRLVEKIGFDDDPKLVVVKGAVKYISPLKKKDNFLLKVKIYDYSTTEFYIEDLIFKLPNQECFDEIEKCPISHEPILKGKFTMALLDENFRPSPIPPSMIFKFNQFCQLEGN